MNATQRKVLLASAIGSALEWYDFFIYGTAAALVFGELFFPDLDPTVATLAAFATFGSGFAARPLGGVVFGHLGDRLGRKPVLVMTLLFVGGGTFLIGLLPTYKDIGLLAPILLVLLRLLQGFATGAEYGGAVLLAVEYAPERRRGLFGSFAAIGIAVGNLMAVAVFAILAFLPKDEFLSWGWRLPFLLSITLVIVGLYIRSRVSETPVFQEVVAKHKAVRSPVIEVVRRHPREIFVVIGARMAENGLGYLFSVFALNYLTQTLKVPKDTALTGIMIAHALSLLTIPLFAMLSDRVGRRAVYIGAALFGAAYAFPFFLLIETKVPLLVALAFIPAISIAVSAMNATQAAYFAELFCARLRFSGFALARELGSILAGGIAPFIAAWLVTVMNGESWGVALYIVGMCAITATAVFVGPETHRMDLRADKHD